MPSKKHGRKKGEANKSKTSKSSASNSADDIHQWLGLGCVDAKRLSRQLPDVAQAIRDGRLKANQVPKIVQQANQDSTLSELKKHLPDVKGMPIHRMGGLETMTKAEPLLCDLVRIACSCHEEMSHAFAHAFFHEHKDKWGNVRDTIHLEGRQIVHVKNVGLILEVQCAYDQACDRFRRPVERLTRKPIEEHVWAYKKDLVDFLLILGNLIYLDEHFSLEDLCRDVAHTESIKVGHKVEAAARGVENGWDTVRHQCWECGLNNLKVYTCSCCKAARCCSKKCQHTSWKSGHKGACADLMAMYKGYKANCRRIDIALQHQSDKHETPMYEGCPLAPAGTKDCLLLPILLSNWTFPVVVNVDIVGSGCASIDHMCKSLADTVSGRRHWMFEDTFEGTQQAFLDTTTLERADTFEVECMIQGLLFLTVDLSKIKPTCGVHVAVSLFKQQLRKSSADGELMSAKRFIAICYRFGLGERKGYEDPAARLKHMAKCVEIMMNHFHKKKGSLDVAALHKAIGQPCPFQHA